MIAADEVLSRVWGMLIGRERAPLAQIIDARPVHRLVERARDFSLYELTVLIFNTFIS